MFDYRVFDVFFDPGRAMSEVLGLARRQVCQAARQAYGRYVGRALDATVYTARIPRLPGLEIRPARGNPASPRPPPGAGERFRQLMGGQ